MLMRLTKAKDGRAKSITFVRDDGSVTRALLNLPAVHDLSHYAVETELGMTEAFLGMIASGTDLAAFDVSGATKQMHFPDESIWAEQIVGLFQMEMFQGELMADFDEQLARPARKSDRPPPPAIPDETKARIRARIAELVYQWHQLPAGETMDLTWTPPTAVTDAARPIKRKGKRSARS